MVIDKKEFLYYNKVNQIEKGESKMLVQFLTIKTRLTKLSGVLKQRQHSSCDAKNCVSVI